MARAALDPETGVTKQQEHFCQEMVATGNASEAYREAYSTGNMKVETIHRKAKELLDNGKVAARIISIQQQVAQRNEVTHDSLLNELEQARTLAISNNQVSSAVAATMGKARICGLDKQILSNDPDNPLPSAISIEIIRP